MEHTISVNGNEITITPDIDDIYVKFENGHWIVRCEGSMDHCYSLAEAVQSATWKVESREKADAHMAQLMADHEAALKEAENDPDVMSDEEEKQFFEDMADGKLAIFYNPSTDRYERNPNYKQEE